MIKLTGFTTLEVDCLLHFLYAGCIDFDSSFPETPRLVALLRTWKVADFFCLGPLQVLLTQALNDIIEAMTRVFCPRYDSDETTHNVDMVIEDEILPAIRALYQDDVAAVKDKILPHILGLVIAGMHRLHLRENFRNIFQEVPEFAVDWSVTFMEGMCTSFPHRLRDSESCHDCGHPVYESDGTVDGFEWMKSMTYGLLCPDCFYVPTVSEWLSY